MIHYHGTDYITRLLQHSGVYPDYTREPENLADGRPNVKTTTLLFERWWGSGVVHAKVWISDRRDVYIGSANNDWKSLTQVPFFSKNNFYALLFYHALRCNYSLFLT